MGHWEPTQGAGTKRSSASVPSALIRAQCAHLYNRGSQVSLWSQEDQATFVTQQ